MKRLRLCLAALCCVLFAAGMQAQDRLRIVRNIVVGTDEKADNVTCVGCSVRVRGSVQGDAVAIGGDVGIEGNLAGDAVAVGGGIRIGPGANFAGDAVAIGRPIQKDPTSHVAGDQIPLPWFALPGQRHLYLRGVAALAGTELALFLISYAIARRRRAENVAGTFSGRPIWAFVIGLVVIGAAAGLYALADMLKGWSDAVVWSLTALLMIVFALGNLGLCYWMDRTLLRETPPFLAALAGAVVLLALQLIPVFGFFVFGLLFVLAAGCATFSGLGSVRRGVAPA